MLKIYYNTNMPIERISSKEGLPLADSSRVIASVSDFKKMPVGVYNIASPHEAFSEQAYKSEVFTNGTGVVMYPDGYQHPLRRVGDVFLLLGQGQSPQEPLVYEVLRYVNGKRPEKIISKL